MWETSAIRFLEDYVNKCLFVILVAITVVLSAFLNIGIQSHPESQHTPQLLHLFTSIVETVEITEVFGDRP